MMLKIVVRNYENHKTNGNMKHRKRAVVLCCVCVLGGGGGGGRNPPPLWKQNDLYNFPLLVTRCLVVTASLDGFTKEGGWDHGK